MDHKKWAIQYSKVADDRHEKVTTITTTATLPVQVESCNLGVVAFEVREVKVIGECLLLPGESGKGKNTDYDRL